jgi:hypothetical protein
MFHEMHLGVAVQLPQQSATSLVLKDLRIGIALCKLQTHALGAAAGAVSGWRCPY